MVEWFCGRAVLEKLGVALHRSLMARRVIWARYLAEQ